MSNSIVVLSQEELQQVIERLLEDFVQKKGATSQPPPPDIIDSDELCRRLGISIPTLLRYRKKGKVPFLTLGDAIRYDFHAVIKAIEKQQS